MQKAARSDHPAGQSRAERLVDAEDAAGGGDDEEQHDRAHEEGVAGRHGAGQWDGNDMQRDQERVSKPGAAFTKAALSQYNTTFVQVICH